MSTPTPSPSASRLIASVPGIIGFLPWRSLILILIPARTDPGHADAAALPHFDLTDSATSITDRLGPLLTTMGPVIGYVLVVDDRLRPPHHDASSARTGETRDHRLVEHVVRVLADRSVLWQGSFAATAIVAGGAWWSLSGPADSGTLPGYAILIDDRLTPAATPESDHPGYRLAEYLTAAFAGGPVPIAASWATHALDPERPWWPLPATKESTTTRHLPATLLALSYTQQEHRYDHGLQGRLPCGNH